MFEVIRVRWGQIKVDWHISQIYDCNFEHNSKDFVCRCDGLARARCRGSMAQCLDQYTYLFIDVWSCTNEYSLELISVHFANPWCEIRQSDEHESADHVAESAGMQHQTGY